MLIVIRVFTCIYKWIILITISNLSSFFREKRGKVCFALLSLVKKLICQILTSKFAPSLVYHGLIRTLLSLALIINNSSNISKKQTITFPWVPNVGPKIKKEIHKFGCRVALKTDPILKNILCKNKDKLIPNSYPRVYELKYSCGSVYNCDTKKKFIIRSIEHQQKSWSSSGATKHTKECHGYFDWLHPKTHSMKKRYHDRKVRESFEIDKAVVRYGQYKVLDKNNEEFVKRNAWKSLFKKMKTLH